MEQRHSKRCDACLLSNGLKANNFILHVYTCNTTKCMNNSEILIQTIGLYFISYSIFILRKINEKCHIPLYSSYENY